MARRRICVIVTARPSWAKLQTVCEAIQAHPDLELQIVVCASALLERYGKTIDVIKAQGFEVAAEVYSTYEGANLVTSAKDTASLLGSLVDQMPRLRSHAAVVCADRHEVLGAAQAVSYLHVPLVHLQGGERSGSIDDKVRDAITALADLHFPCTESAAFRVYALTGAYERIWNFGCSSIDLAKRAQSEPPVTAEELGGAGKPIDLSQPFGVLLQHPVTSEADQAHEQMHMTLEAWPSDLPCLAFWPGQDAGADGASKAIRETQASVHTVRNLPPDRFLRLLGQCAVLVGNSSAGIRESAYLGVPVVNIGSRQQGREHAANVVDVGHSARIAHTIARQVQHGPYPSSPLYGSGNAGERIAEVLARVDYCADTRSGKQQGNPGQESQAVGR